MRGLHLLSLAALACAPTAGELAPKVTDATNAEIAFSTRLGGAERDMDMVRDVTSDSAGNVYITGNTSSPDFPVTPGSYDTTWEGGQFPSDAFVAKLSPDGQLLWSTFLGGPGYERAYAIERASNGDLVVAGRAGPGLPVTPGVLQPQFGGDQSNRPPYGRQDGFICRLSGDGRTLRFCTYLGTGDNGFIRDLDLDAQDNVVVVMGSVLGDLPRAWFANAFQPQKSGDEDVVVAKVSADGSRMLWATYLGGSKTEIGAPSVCLAPDGSVVVLLSTLSPDLPTPGGFDATLGGGQDLYVAHLSADGSQVLMGTYVGGTGIEAIETHGLGLGPDGTVYVTGATTSGDLPTTPGSWQPVAPPGDAGNGFLMRISPEGTLLASTYVGGRDLDYGEGIAVDSAGRVYLTGYTESGDILGAPGADPDPLKGDLFAAVFPPDLTSLSFGTRIGGSDRDMGRAIAPADGWILIVGQSASTDWPGHAALSAGARLGTDGVVVRLRPRAP